MIHKTLARRLLWCLLFLVLAALAWLPRASAEEVIEAWRSSLGALHSVSANPSDGSCWLIDETEFCTTCQDDVGRTLVRLADDGTELSRGGGRFEEVWAVAVDPTDGSCWVADAGNSQIVHLARDGSELWRGAGLTAMSLAVNPSVYVVIKSDTEDRLHFGLMEGVPAPGIGALRA